VRTKVHFMINDAGQPERVARALRAANLGELADAGPDRLGIYHAAFYRSRIRRSSSALVFAKC
jgi:hypothetical protein